MIKMIQKNMNKKGFTLVELIIVIAVMAILAAIVVPRMSGITKIFRENADERVCANYAREIELHIQTGKITPADDATGLVSGLTDIDVDKAPQSDSDADATTDEEYYYLLEETAVDSGVFKVYVYTDEAGGLTEANVLLQKSHVLVENVQVIK